MVRRPARLDGIYDVLGAASEDARALVRQVISRYSQPEDALLIKSADGVVDISHESLISHWNKLAGWVTAEREAVSWYARAADDAVRYRQYRTTWRDPYLAVARKYLEEGTWTGAWAARLPDAAAPLAEVKEFLDRGAAEQETERRAAEARRDKELTDAKELREAAEARARAERRAKM